MKNNKLVRFVESFVLLPAITMFGAPVGPISQIAVNIVNTPSFVSLEKSNIEIFGALAVSDARNRELEIEKAEKAKNEKAKAIDTYFGARNMPLEGTGMKMVEEAEKNGLDWRLLPAIAVRESTGGKQACKRVSYSSFGWGSCRIGFKSNEEGIEVVAKNLGGNNPKTAHHYDEKTTVQILRAYNPPSIVPRYAEQVINIMNKIGEPEKDTDVAEIASNLKT